MHQALDVPIARTGENTIVAEVGARVICYNPEDQSESKVLSAYVPST